MTTDININTSIFKNICVDSTIPEDKIKTINNLKLSIYERLADTNPNTKEQSKKEAEEELSDYIKSKFYIKSLMQDEKDEVWAYDEGIYINQGKSIIKKELRKILGLSYNQFLVKKVIDKIIADTFIKSSDFFIEENPYLLPTKNCIVDLKTLTRIPYHHKYKFFSKLEILYNSESLCPEIHKHLNKVFNSKEDILLFQEAIGNCLLRKYKYQKSIMFSGSGRNGKGVTIELIKSLFGMSNCASESLQDLEKEFHTCNLHSKFVNIIGDMDKTSLKQTGLFKGLTGDDMVSAARKFMTPINFSNYAKFIFSCNELPIVYDESRGFWDRWLFFDFNKTFVSEEEYNIKENKTNYEIINQNTKEKLLSETELQGFLNFAIAGFVRLEKNNGFSSSTTHENIKLKWTCKSDSFLSFCYDNIETSSLDYIPKEELRQVYSSYCTNKNLYPFNDKHIIQILTTKFGSTELQKTINKFDEKTNSNYTTRKRVWSGIKFRN